MVGCVACRDLLPYNTLGHSAFLPVRPRVTSTSLLECVAAARDLLGPAQLKLHIATMDDDVFVSSYGCWVTCRGTKRRPANARYPTTC